MFHFSNFVLFFKTVIITNDWILHSVSSTSGHTSYNVRFLNVCIFLHSAYNCYSYFISSVIDCSVRHAFIRIKTYCNCCFVSFQMPLTFDPLTASSIDSIIHINFSRRNNLSIGCLSSIRSAISKNPKNSRAFSSTLSILVVAVVGNMIYQKN